MQCKHILLGVAHDNGYVPALDPYRNNAQLVSQITLLKPPNPGREYKNLPFKPVIFDSVFRSEELPDTPTIGKPSYANLAKIPAIPQQKIRAPQSPVNTTKVIASRGLPSDRPLYPGPILLNQDEERLDEPFDEPSAKAWANLDQRLQTGKHCNDFHLRGDCWNAKCQYLHGTPLRGDELVAFALRARQTPCNLGSGCRSRTCVLGHVCRNAPYCTRGATCYFKRLHHVNLQFDHEYED